MTYHFAALPRKALHNVDSVTKEKGKTDDDRFWSEGRDKGSTGESLCVATTLKPSALAFVG